MSRFNSNYSFEVFQYRHQSGSLMDYNITRLTDIFKTVADFPGEEIAAPALGLALSAPAGRKSVPARPPRGF